MKKRSHKSFNIFKSMKKAFLRLSNLQLILIVYLFVTLLASGLLMLPISQKEPNSVSFVDALFTAASAFSDTGLTTKVTVETWTDFGQFLILLLILLGGVGIFALKVWIINIVFRKSISITSRNVLEKERGSSSMGELKKTIKVSISFLFITIILFTFILWPMFFFEKGQFEWQTLDGSQEVTKNFSQYDPHGNVALSFKCAIFHCISAINNAGFDILSDSSLTPYYGVYSIQIVFIILLVIGGIGFPVIYDAIQFIGHKIRRRTDFRFSLFTKVSCITYLSVFIVGLSLVLLFEIPSKYGIWQNGIGSSNNKMMCIFFHVFSTRNAGFTTLDPSSLGVLGKPLKFTDPSLVVFSILMFIGSSPSSTAGGIRTTTLAIILVAIWNKMRGVKGVRVFKRSIDSNTIYSSFIVLAISTIIIFVASLICFTSLDTLWGTAPSSILTFSDIFYDVCSAFGTTGLSTGLTSALNIPSKLILILVMFIGQLGISSTMLVWRKSNKKNKYNYMEESILIG